MKKRQDNFKIYKYIYKLGLEYYKLFIIIAMCLIGMAVFSFAQPLIIRKITDQGMLAKDMRAILVFSMLLLVGNLFYQILDTFQTKMFSNVHNGIYFDLQKKAYKKISKIKMDYYYENGSAEIFFMINNDIETISSIANQMTTLSISSVLQVFGGIIGLAMLNVKMAFLIFLLIPIKFVVIWWFSKKKRHIIQTMLNNKKDLSGWMGDCISGIREMKLWNLFPIKYKGFEKIQQGILNSYCENCMWDKYKQVSFSFLDTVLTVLIYILSGYLIIKGNFTIGSALAFITYCGYVVSPISFLVDIKYYFEEIKPAAMRFIDFMAIPEEQTESIPINYKKESIIGNNKTLPVLEIKDLRFGYKPEIPILKNVNLTVYAGEKIAIIGENGSGKSTLLDLIAGFYVPQNGSIKINGILIKELGIKKVREMISMVSQKPFFFRGTIEQNINIDQKLTHDNIVECCKKSGIDNFISKFEYKYDQLIGQNGAKLSGGERQKLAIIRALTKHAEILILDEATAGVDKETDKKMIEYLCKELKEQTIIFVTHKYEELENIQNIYELSGGELNLIKQE